MHQNLNQKQWLENTPGTILPATDFWAVMQWATQQTYCWAAYGDQREIPAGVFPKLIAWAATGSQDDVHDTSLFDHLKEEEQFNQWWFGLIGYDQSEFTSGIKHQVANPLNQPSYAGFIPEGIAIMVDNGLKLIGNWPDVFPSILEDCRIVVQQPVLPIWTKEAYTEQFEAVKKQIKLGYTYELNLCMPLTGKLSIKGWAALFALLTQEAPAPFAGFFKAGSHFVWTASPERFIKIFGQTILSQPIKGTAKRSTNSDEDARIKSDLVSSEKEQAENMMIVDLVRNDLTPYAVPGTITVDEYIKCYSFSHVHQLISTVSAQLSPGASKVEAIENAFPMGSMTGAPKISTMKIINELEPYARGWFSGSLMFKTPDHNFDGNVLIRSLFWNAETGQAMIWAGGAITWDADPEAEYQECLLKAALWQTLINKISGPINTEKSESLA